MAKPKHHYLCQSCGYKAPKWLGQCPGCGTWESLEEVTERARPRAGVAGGLPARVVTYGSIEPRDLVRFSSGFGELDRVLGGGLVPGSLLLLGGDPGIGKSTLMLQVADRLCGAGKSVLYVSGEESAAQIKMRGERLAVTAGELELLAETDYDVLEGVFNSKRYDVVFVDSIQTMYTPKLPSGPGSITQVREVTNNLLGFAKSRATTVVLIGHITKEGSLAGPKTLEHMVDGVFYFEGDKYHRLRLVRSQKNRFGPAQELGIFQMMDRGLEEVGNPSSILLEQRPESATGSVVVPCMEGSRPLLIEVQVLLSNSAYASPRRVAMGIDQQRLALIMAVLEKKAGLQLGGLDVFVNVVGGIHIQEPAIDLGLALAVYSSFRNLVLAANVAVFGELGLAGEVRSVSSSDLRLKECRNLGFDRIICPPSPKQGKVDGGQVVHVTTLIEALEQAL